ncbi:hypothetical protein [Streptomyces sp. H39-S7]|uniref:hypothetical protein n=1 Tax=Streptomyces sp. H39-S7 TaxID=3004357 RepID=UPI0022AEE24F|nr:hypothetical protein [Streptomyces sp. H39-S7]MCZ4126044.1 hypothetical protein [Streptomyces sp. H39-S7]
MSDWTWEYDPDAENVVGGLPDAVKERVEAVAQRLAEAAGVAHIGQPFDIAVSGVSGVMSFSEGWLTVWYLEDGRAGENTVLVLAVNYVDVADPQA